MRRRAYLAGLAGPLAGCPSERRRTETAEPTTVGRTTTRRTTTADVADRITFWADAQLGTNEDAFGTALYQAGLDEAVTVEVEYSSLLGFRYLDAYYKWLTEGREEPTLLYVDSGWTLSLHARTPLQRLDALAPDGTFSAVRTEYLDPLVATATGLDGGLVAQPLFVDAPTVQYRQDLFRRAGYGESDFRAWRTDPPTWQAFAEIVVTVAAESGTEYGFTFPANEYPGLACCSFTEFMSGWGGAYFGDPSRYLFGPVGERPITVDEQPVRDAVRMVRSLVNGPDAEHALDGYPAIAPESVLNWTAEPARKPFTDGRAVAHRNWPYSIDINASEDNFGRDLGVMPIPYAVTEAEARYPMTGGPVAALGGWHAAVNPHATAAKKRAAIRVLEAMQAPSFQRWAFETVGWLPSQGSLFDDGALRSVEPLGRYLDTLAVATGNAIPRPVTRVWPQESDAISTQVHAALAGKRPPAGALGDLSDRLETIERSNA